MLAQDIQQMSFLPDVYKRQVFGKASLFEEPKEKKESEENEARAHVVISPFKGEDAKEAAQICLLYTSRCV